jgi:hypothetical protein
MSLTASGASVKGAVMRVTLQRRRQMKKGVLVLTACSAIAVATTLSVGSASAQMYLCLDNCDFKKMEEHSKKLEIDPLFRHLLEDAQHNRAMPRPGH